MCLNILRFATLPDGDLSGLTLSYQETRENCIPLDSDLYPTVDWPTLRVWANNGSGEQIYQIPLASYATAVAGSYQSATVQFTLGGTVTAGDYVGHRISVGALSVSNELAATRWHSRFKISLQGINAFSATMSASWPGTGTTITITYLGTGLPTNSTTGANGNRNRGRIPMFRAARRKLWDAPSRQFSGGTSPSQWQITLPFASLTDPVLRRSVPATAIRKLRWTYAAALQAGAFVRSEFQVVVSNWTVTGTGRATRLPVRAASASKTIRIKLQYTRVRGPARAETIPAARFIPRACLDRVLVALTRPPKTTLFT